MEQFRGKIGDLVFKRYGHEVIVARAADLSGRPPTPGQQAARERFKLATVYGRTALADPATRTLYDTKAKAKGEPVFAAAVSDFFHAPVVEAIDLSRYTGKAGETIRVVASDDFEVKDVAVRFLATDGTAIEEGPAQRNGSTDSEWFYQTKTGLATGQSVSIEVTASDRPGNKTTRRETRA
ncbi:MAG: hypothetical protein ACYDH9_24225 [Limisphaerales bacterium]